MISSLSLLLPAFLSLAHQVSSHPACRPNNEAASMAKAVYFLTNDDTNAVVALPIGADGTLSRGTTTETGGSGSIALNSDGQPATPDALVGQSALTVAGNHIFAVNAGSNTLSMLAISSSDPTQLTMVGEPVEIPGTFPNTVAASVKNGLVCVGTTGSQAGISCGSFSEEGIGAMDCLRPFDIGQTTPPVGPTNTVSQVFFSDDQSTLFTTVKGDPAVNKTGFLSAFAVEQSANGKAMSLAVEDVRSSPEGTAVLFGSQPIPGTSNIFATDASFGAAILSVDPSSQKATTLAAQKIDGQVATCWATLSSATNTAFVTDVAANRIVEMSLEDASIVSTLDLPTGDPGLIDLRAAGKFVYALSPGNGTTEAAITVIKASRAGSAKLVQHFGLQGLAGPTAQGMAVLA
ncbi:hypothetical protein ACJ41O_010314 [Fusarium nematophilum]